MANPTVLSLQLAAAVSNGICLAQQPLAAGALTLNGSLVTGGVATMDVGRRVSIASTGSDAAVVFTIKGTDNTPNQNIVSETITGVVSGTPVASLGNYKTITSVTSSAATAGNITVGTNSVGSTVWGVLDFMRRNVNFSVGGGITGPAGTTYTLELCYSDPNSLAGQGIVGAEQWSMSPAGLVPPHVYTYAGITGASGDNQFSFGSPIFGLRLTINSGTGLVTLEAIQAGID
jgi:hypothetical protein